MPSLSDTIHVRQSGLISLTGPKLLPLNGVDDEEFVLAPDHLVEESLFLPGIDKYQGVDYFTVAYLSFRIQGMWNNQVR